MLESDLSDLFNELLNNSVLNYRRHCTNNILESVRFEMYCNTTVFNILQNRSQTAKPDGNWTLFRDITLDIFIV